MLSILEQFDQEFKRRTQEFEQRRQEIRAWMDAAEREKEERLYLKWKSSVQKVTQEWEQLKRMIRWLEISIWKAEKDMTFTSQQADPANGSEQNRAPSTRAPHVVLKKSNGRSAPPFLPDEAEVHLPSARPPGPKENDASR